MGLFALGEDFVRGVVEALVQAALEAERTEAIGAVAKGERSETRLSQRSGYSSRSLIIRGYSSRSLIIRVGTLRLRVPQDPTHQCVRPDLLDLRATAKPYYPF
jgi:transposase-like protein